jgi:type III pantothenate kinase
MKMPETAYTLTVDVGNSRIKFGLFERPEPAPVNCALPTCADSLAVAVGTEVDWNAVRDQFGQRMPRITQAVMAGVNPAEMTRLLAGWSQSGWPAPRIIDRAAELPLRTDVENPDHVGIDRLLDTVAANLLRAEHQPAVIIDAGTATTVNAVSPDGVFLGGAILPGLALQARSLHQYTALLPLIDVRSLADDPVDAVGRNTYEAISSGLWFGQVGAIRELTDQYVKSGGGPHLLLVTGGMGRWLAPALGADFRFEPHLALRGLAFVAQSK